MIEAPKLKVKREETIDDTKNAQKECATDYNNCLQWKDLQDPQLNEEIIKCLLENFHFTYVAKVQLSGFKLIENNICIQACTGSGKTMAFLLPILQWLMNLREGKLEEIWNKNTVYALILLPSRELAIQIIETIRGFKTREPLSFISSLLAIGGTDISSNITDYSTYGANILVGTIGRITDLTIIRREINLGEVKYLILDEADRLLGEDNLDKVKQINALISREDKKVGLYSATLNQGKLPLKELNMNNESDVKFMKIDIYKGENIKTGLFAKKDVNEINTNNIVNEDISETPSSILNYYIITETEVDKWVYLIKFLYKSSYKVIIFVSTCACVEFYYEILPKLKYLSHLNFMKEHGKLPQKQRNRTFREFIGTGGHNMVLICTDLIARGIDVPDVDWIIQFHPPQSSNTFYHRIGRTGRASNTGNSLLFLMEEESAYINYLQLKSLTISEYPINLLEPVDKITKESIIAPEGIIEKENTKKQTNKRYINSVSPASIILQIKSILKTDRGLIDKSTSAFLSYLRSYKEHDLTFLFEYKKLNIASLAHSFGLFRIPLVKELKGAKVLGFVEEKIDIMSIPYRDKNTEKQRIGNKMKRIQKREEMRTLQMKEGIKNKKERQKQGGKRIGNKKKTKREINEREWDEFQREERLAKKLKKGKITQDEFDQLVQKNQANAVLQDTFNYQAQI